MINFLIIVNDKYVKYAKSLIRSIFETNRKYKIFLYVINPTVINLEILRNKAKQYKLEIRTIFKNLNQDKGDQIYSEEAAFSANIRGKLLKEIAEVESIKNLIYLDADTLIRAPLREFSTTKSELAFYVRKDLKSPKKNGCFSGLIFVNLKKDKEKLISTIDYYQSKIDEYGLTTWYSDQNALEDIYKNYLKEYNVSLWSLPKELFDWEFNDGSKIWMGKGKTKANVKYVEEQERCENAF